VPEAGAVLRQEPTGTSRGFVAVVAVLAKKDLQPGDVLDGEGGYTVFGRLVGAPESLSRSFLPMGLTGKARTLRPVAKDAVLTYGDVQLDEDQFAYQLRKPMEAEYSGRQGPRAGSQPRSQRSQRNLAVCAQRRGC
jgi:predicted homoserine dehydrogenase-like protein